MNGNLFVDLCVDDADSQINQSIYRMAFIIFDLPDPFAPKIIMLFRRSTPELCTLRNTLSPRALSDDATKLIVALSRKDIQFSTLNSISMTNPPHYRPQKLYYICIFATIRRKCKKIIHLLRQQHKRISSLRSGGEKRYPTFIEAFFLCSFTPTNPPAPSWGSRTSPCGRAARAGGCAEAARRGSGSRRYGEGLPG